MVGRYLGNLRGKLRGPQYLTTWGYIRFRV